VIFGHVALSQINKTGEGGRGLAIAGLVIGYVSCALSVIYFIAAFAAASSGY
jgi:peptidyl-prolyl cis-trans isomerase B (cyclophilin B)